MFERFSDRKTDFLNEIFTRQTSNLLSQSIGDYYGEISSVRTLLLLLFVEDWSHSNQRILFGKTRLSLERISDKLSTG